MTEWLRVLSERTIRRSPVAVRVVDDFTGGQVVGSLSIALEIDLGGVGGFRPAEAGATTTPSGYVVFLGLGRRLDPAGAATRRYRMRLESPLYGFLYGTYPSFDNIEFDVPPYGDASVPTAPTPRLDVFALPRASYPFAAEIPVVRGSVVDAAAADAPLANALVAIGTTERVLTDARGEFALPARWSARGATVSVDISAPDGRTATSSVVIPDDATHAVVLQVT